MGFPRQDLRSPDRGDLRNGFAIMNMIDDDKVMYNKLDYGMLLWIVDYIWGDRRTIGDGGCHSN